jgi:hypothetical protein
MVSFQLVKRYGGVKGKRLGVQKIPPLAPRTFLQRFGFLDFDGAPFDFSTERRVDHRRRLQRRCPA